MLRPADEWLPEQLPGKRVAFRSGEEHAACWHAQVGLTAGTVLRVALSPSQKAELLRAEGLEMPELAEDEAQPLRVWVKADACAAFPRGCDTAVEIPCLLVLDS